MYEYVLVVPVTLLYIPACAVGGHREDVTGLTLELDGGIGGSLPAPLSLEVLPTGPAL